MGCNPKKWEYKITTFENPILPAMSPFKLSMIKPSAQFTECEQESESKFANIFLSFWSDSLSPFLYTNVNEPYSDICQCGWLRSDFFPV